jgi:hypothetical protein
LECIVCHLLSILIVIALPELALVAMATLIDLKLAPLLLWLDLDLVLDVQVDVQAIFRKDPNVVGAAA